MTFIHVEKNEQLLLSAVVAEWLRRLTRNQIPSGSVGSNPTDCDIDRRRFGSTSQIKQCKRRFLRAHVLAVMGKKRKLDEHGEEDFEFDPPPKHLTVPHLKEQEKRLIIILEGAQLETISVNRGFELMNADDHASTLRKHNREPYVVRPDIVHQCLLMLMDSPLNRAALLQVYIHTEKNVLIEINPQTRIPRTFKRFAGLMVQLLHRFKVRASDGNMKLLKVIKNPVTSHLPVGCKKYAMSFSADKIVNPRELVPADEPIVIVVGAMAHGSVSVDYTEKTFSISNYPLSAALTCTKLCSAFEEVWGVI